MSLSSPSTNIPRHNLPFWGPAAWHSRNTTMSFNCLTCGQILQRVNSDRDDECLPPQETKKPNRKVAMQVDRSWSRNMTPPKYARSGPLVKVKAEHHRRTNSEGDVGPRLVRSSGMRREWSLEDLAGQQQDKGVRCYWDIYHSWAINCWILLDFSINIVYSCILWGRKYSMIPWLLSGYIAKD